MLLLDSPANGPIHRGGGRTTATRWRWRPTRARWCAGFAREDLFTVVLEQFQTDTADYADYVLPATTQLEHWDIHTSYGHTDVLLNRPAVAPRRRGAHQHRRVSRARARAWASTSPASRRRRRDAVPQRLRARQVDFERVAGAGLQRLALPEAPFAATADFPRASGRCEFFSARLAARGEDGLPDHVPNYETGRQFEGVSAGHDLAAGAQLPQLEFRQREEPA
jgi:anaerobic selenocysteine-containing dehydrogenase